VSVRLDDEPVSAGAGPSQWDVTIDGAAKPTLVLTQGTSDYSLASALASGVHTVELYKRSEAQDGVTQLIAFDFGGGTLLAPPPRAGRTIELVGDSQAAGFGVDGVGIVCQPPAWAARYENFHESFGAVLGQLLGADVVGTVFSGKGVARNVWRPDLDTMPVLYKRADPLDGASVQDMGAIAADAVVVVLGGNDFDAGQPTDDGPLPLATFEAAYDAFLTTIRTAHPSAQIFLVVPPTVSDDYPAGRNARTNVIQAVNDLVAKRADPKMHAATPGAAAYSELTGCDGHGNPAYHQRVAKELAAVVGPVMGW
jgi:lysophospholipase L1-like esterase